MENLKIATCIYCIVVPTEQFHFDKFDLHPEVFTPKPTKFANCFLFLYSNPKVFNHGFNLKSTKNGRIEVVGTENEINQLITELKKYKIIDLNCDIEMKPGLVHGYLLSKTQIEDIDEFCDWVVSSHNDAGLILRRGDSASIKAMHNNKISFSIDFKGSRALLTGKSFSEFDLLGPKENKFGVTCGDSKINIQ